MRDVPATASDHPATWKFGFPVFHPEDAAARAGRGRDLLEREYSVERYREKIARAYETVARLARR